MTLWPIDWLSWTGLIIAHLAIVVAVVGAILVLWPCRKPRRRRQRVLR